MLKNSEVIKKFFMYCGYEECHNDNLSINSESRQLISFNTVIAEFVKLKRGNVVKTFLLINPVKGNKARSKHITEMYKHIIALYLHYIKVEINKNTIELLPYARGLLPYTNLLENNWKTLN